MHRTFLLLISSCFTFIVNAQVDIKTYVSENAAPVRTIEPDSINYSDLEALGNAIGNSTIVMLGEQDHGDGATFLAKTRLIRYLHEKKGFNVVAFENDFFTSNFGWDRLVKTKTEMDSFLKKSILPYWTYCDAGQYLFFNLIPKTYNTPAPIQITGFDNQMFLKQSIKYLAAGLDSVLRSHYLNITKKENYATVIIPQIDSLTRLSAMQKDDAFYDTALEYLYLIKDAMNTKPGKDNFWTLVVENLISTAKEFKYLKTSSFKGQNERDIQMARNLSWLSKVKYPGEKIIVWAQNWHISKYSGNYPQKYMNEGLSMAMEFIKDDVQNKQTYSIGFTSNTGSAGRIMSKPFTVDKPVKNSIESWVNESYDYAFIDFTPFNRLNANNKTEFLMKGSTEGVHKNQLAQWTRNFDGIFYIKKMYPCVFVK